MDLYGKSYLMNKLVRKRDRVLRRYDYYDMKNRVLDFGIATPRELKWIDACLGWCAKSVDSLADRIVFREFRNDYFGMNEIFKNNNLDVLTDSAILGAMISSCDFIYIRKDENDEVKLQVIDGSNATGIIDTRTNLLREGYAVLERNEDGDIIADAYFTPTQTEYTVHGVVSVEANPTGVPLLVPIIYRPDASRPFGRARITRAGMSAVNSAVRTLRRSEVAAEFYSYPQKWVSGLDPDAEVLDTWKASISTMLTFDASETGNPTVGQFTAHSMEPHVKQFEMFARQFAADSDLTVDDLGISSGNPTSAEAIRASHENLRLKARKAQRTFGTGFLNVGYVASCLRDEMTYPRSQYNEVKVIYEPIFEPDVTQLGAIGDASLKLAQAKESGISSELLRDLTGFEL